MAGYHVVRQGECLASLAKLYGFPHCETIANHPANAELLKTRPNIHVLLPGDAVFIPDPIHRVQMCGTDQAHQFRCRLPKTVLRLKLVDSDGEPLSGASYKLCLEGKTETGTIPHNGILEHPVPPRVEQANLSVSYTKRNTSRHAAFNLLIGSLDPADEISGVQARLQNLGFFSGEVTRNDDSKTRAALRDFQEATGDLEIDGRPTSRTRSKLKEQHGC